MTKRTVVLNAERLLSIVAGATTVLVMHITAQHGSFLSLGIPQDPKCLNVADRTIGLSAVYMSRVTENYFAWTALGLCENDVGRHLVIFEGIHDINHPRLLGHTLERDATIPQAAVA